MNPARDDEFRRPVSRRTASRSATSPAAFEPAAVAAGQCWKSLMASATPVDIAAVADRDDTDETLVFV